MDDAPVGGTLDYAWRRGGQRPLTLPEHVAFAGERLLSAVLEIRRGPIEIGRLEFVRGQVVHAELPGTAGEPALRLLARLGPVEIEVAARADEGPQTVAGGGRGLIPAASLDDDARQQLMAVYAPLMTPVRVSSPPPSAPATDRRGAARDGGAARRRSQRVGAAQAQAGRSAASSPRSSSSSAPREPTSAAAREDFDAVFVEAMRAYARRDYRGALERFELCASLRPDDARVRHNIDRLRRRLGDL